ncbi:ATP-binding protein [Streptomyces sp. NPDC014646]|uniref:ATP-binding protein n=1 Tax=Streptomyces sp. NPDC014646 TaxID=3364877 RepID=UPI0036FBBEB1
MSADAHDAFESVPGPAPTVPPPPAHAPAPPRPDGTAVIAWLRAPRPDAPVGIWRLGHRPRPEEEPEQVPGRQLIAGALLAALVAWCVWSLLYNGYVGLWWLLPLELVTPDSWRHGQAGPVITMIVYYGYYALIAGGLLYAAGRMGRWPDVWRRYVTPHVSQARAAGEIPVPEAGEDPVQWPHLRTAGPTAAAAADRLVQDVHAGQLRDVDHARITQAWQTARSKGRTDVVAKAVSERGAAAFPHPSGARDLPARTATHDLITHQVRLGTVVDGTKNPWSFRGAGIAADPDVLGTGMLVVGPAGSGKTRHITRPITEALCLQALAGRAAVVAVGPAGTALGPAGQYDIRIRLGHPESTHDLDLYGGTTDPDEAAAILTEALAGDLTSDPDRRRGAAILLSRLLGPYRAAHGRFPSVPDLRQLLEGTPAAHQELARRLGEAGPAQEAMARDLEAAARQLAVPGGPGPALADRVALLDRPAFRTFFDPEGKGKALSVRSLTHPVRVHIGLPSGGHPDAARVLARLVLAQFLAYAAQREARGLFVALVLDDAAGAVTAEAVRGMQGLRSAHAGLVLGLRTLAEVDPDLRAPLLGAVGCRAVMSGVPLQDGRAIADAWGTEWIETQDVTDRQIIADSTGGKAWHALRKAITGRAVTARAVTTRKVERERWSASELAHSVPPGHAVLSLTSVTGDRTSPLLVDLR